MGARLWASGFGACGLAILYLPSLHVPATVPAPLGQQAPMLPPVARHAGLTSAVPLAAIASPPRMVLPPQDHHEALCIFLL